MKISGYIGIHQYLNQKNIKFLTENLWIIVPWWKKYREWLNSEMKIDTQKYTLFPYYWQCGIEPPWNVASCAVFRSWLKKMLIDKLNCLTSRHSEMRCLWKSITYYQKKTSSPKNVHIGIQPMSIGGEEGITMKEKRYMCGIWCISIN